MSTLLILTSERLDQETRRANDAERKTSDALSLLRSTVEAKMLAQQEAARVGEELRLYKLQFENAQREIFKAQDLINRIEAQRQEAEEAAARARSTARKLKEQNLVMMARDEGRQLGYQEGLERGRSMGYDEARSRARFATPMQEDYATDQGSASEEAEEDESVRQAEPPSNARLRSPFAVPIREQDPPEPIIMRYVLLAPFILVAYDLLDLSVEAPGRITILVSMLPLYLFQRLLRLSLLHLRATLHLRTYLLPYVYLRPCVNGTDQTVNHLDAHQSPSLPIAGFQLQTKTTTFLCLRHIT